MHRYVREQGLKALQRNNRENIMSNNRTLNAQKAVRTFDIQDSAVEGADKELARDKRREDRKAQRLKKRQEKQQRNN